MVATRKSSTSAGPDIEAEIRSKIPRDEIASAVQQVADEAMEYAQGIAPVLTGAYRDSIKIVERPDHDGMPALRLTATDYKAYWIEFGTVAHAATKKKRAHFPTPEFAVFAKTAAAFKGDMNEEP